MGLLEYGTEQVAVIAVASVDLDTRPEFDPTPTRSIRAEAQSQARGSPGRGLGAEAWYVSTSRAPPEDAKTYVAAIGMGIIVLGWLALAGMVVFIAYTIVRGVMIPHARPPGRGPPGGAVS